MLNKISEIGNKFLKLLGEKQDFGLNVNSISAQKLDNYFKHYGLEELFCYRSFDELTKLFHNSKGFGFTLEVSPMVGASKEMQAEISSIFKNILPEGSNIQFLLFADHRVGNLLDNWVSSNSKGGELHRELSQKTADFLKKQVFKDKGNTIRNFRCVISYSQLGDLANNFETEQVIELRSKLVTAFEGLGLDPQVIDANDLLQFLDGIVNISDDINHSRKRWNRYEELNTQVADRGNSFHVDKGGLLINDGNFVAKAYGVKNFPPFWSLHAMNELIGDNFRDAIKLNCPFLIHYGVHLPSQGKIKLKVEGRQDWVGSQARSKIGKRLPIVREQYQELQEVSAETSQGEKYVKTGFNVILLCPRDKLSYHEHILKSLFISKRWELIEDKFIHLQVFLSCLPMSWGDGLFYDLEYHSKLKTTLSTESANLLPIQGDSKGNSLEGLLLISRKGQIQVFDPFENQGNANMIVIGKSGSGKSFFMQALAKTNLARGGKVFVIDVGRSFEKQIDRYGGNYIIFKKGSNICVNPFSNLKITDKDDLDDAIEMLKGVVALMAAPKSGTNESEDSYIEKAIRRSWETKGNNACINDVIENLNLLNTVEAKRLASQMYSYSIDGNFGKYFNGRANVDFNSNFVVVELSDLKGKPHLQSVIFQMMTIEITNQVYLGDRKQRTHLIIDEAWDALRNKQAGGFIETAARRMRKYRGSLVVGTQSAEDFFSTPAARAAYDNSDWACFLAQTASSIKRLRQDNRMEIDDYKERLLKSLQTVKGAYSEIFIQNANTGYFISRLLPDPYSLVLYSTDADEFTAVEEKRKQGMDIATAVAEVAQERYGEC